MPTDIAAQGTAVNALQSFRKFALVAFMDDLVAHRRTGISDTECDQVKASLQQLLNRLAEIPDRKIIRSSVLEQMEKFRKAYERWNDDPKVPKNSKEAIAIRDKWLERMRQHRHCVAAIERRNIVELAEGLDLDLVRSLYRALGTLAEAAPSIFKNLASAIEKYSG